MAGLLTVASSMAESLAGSGPNRGVAVAAAVLRRHDQGELGEDCRDGNSPRTDAMTDLSQR